MSKLMIPGVVYVPTQPRVTIPGTSLVIDKADFTQQHAEMIFDFWEALCKADKSFDVNKAMISTFTLDSPKKAEAVDEVKPPVAPLAPPLEPPVDEVKPPVAEVNDATTDFSLMKVAELQGYAEEHSIDLGDSVLKADILSKVQAWAALPKEK